jgi:hypothetical protein
MATYDFRALPTGRALCFFDDHVSQALRIEQARSWGFDDLIFDDFPTHALHGGGQTPVPTVDMIFEALADGETIEWKAGTHLQKYKFCRAELALLRDRIVFAKRFPDLAWETGYRGSNLTYVRLSAAA